MIITTITILQLGNLASVLTHRAMDNRGNGFGFKETLSIQMHNQEGLHVEQTLVCKGKENKCWVRIGINYKTHAWQDNKEQSAVLNAVAYHAQTIRPWMADGLRHAFAVSHNSRRKWETLGLRPSRPRGRGKRKQHKKWRMKKTKIMKNWSSE